MMLSRPLPRQLYDGLSTNITFPTLVMWGSGDKVCGWVWACVGVDGCVGVCGHVPLCGGGLLGGQWVSSCIIFAVLACMLPHYPMTTFLGIVFTLANRPCPTYVASALSQYTIVGHHVML